MGHLTNMTTPIHGTVSPGFESVRTLYTDQTRQMAEQNSQLCVYFRGQRVVDLWSSASDDGHFSADTLVNVFSSSKSLETIALAWLVSKGLLDYNAKIVEYWPEFGGHEKGEVTVADLMRHEAGLPRLDTLLEFEDLYRENLKQNRVGELIEAQRQSSLASGDKREYHALTRGWIANELFRRIDPAERTIGEFLREDICDLLDADVYVGLDADLLNRRTDTYKLGSGYQLLQSLLPRFLGRRTENSLAKLVQLSIPMIPVSLKNRPVDALAAFKDASDSWYFNDPGFAKGESPSANANCSARGLAKLAAMMAAGGKFEGHTYISEMAWKALHDCPTPGNMGGVLANWVTQGGLDYFRPCGADSTVAARVLNEGREGFYGWMGLGGSIFQWHPDLEIGFAFVPTAMHTWDGLNARGKRFQAEVLRCARQLKK